jgi:hypothetical protein
MIMLEELSSSFNNKLNYLHSAGTSQRLKRSFHHVASSNASEEEAYISFIASSINHTPSQPTASVKVKKSSNAQVIIISFLIWYFTNLFFFSLF